MPQSLLGIAIGYIALPFVLSHQTVAVVQASRGYLLSIPLILVTQYGLSILQGQQRFQDQGGVVLAAAREEGGQRVDDRQRQGVPGVQLGDLVHQRQPLLGPRLALERLAHPADVVAEVEAEAGLQR